MCWDKCSCYSEVTEAAAFRNLLLLDNLSEIWNYPVNDSRANCRIYKKSFSRGQVLTTLATWKPSVHETVFAEYEKKMKLEEMEVQEHVPFIPFESHCPRYHLTTSSQYSNNSQLLHPFWIVNWNLNQNIIDRESILINWNLFMSWFNFT